MPENRKLALNSGTKTYQILTNDDEVCIPSLSSILLAVICGRFSDRRVQKAVLILCVPWIYRLSQKASAAL